MSFEKETDQLILDLPENRKNSARYLWSVFVEATNFKWDDLPDKPFLINDSGAFAISVSFDDFLREEPGKVASRYNLPGGLEEFRSTEPLACAFYLMNSLHETLLPADKWDKYKRYPYQESIQHANDLIETNYVQDIFDELHQKITGKPPEKEESKIMWSHDIDYLYSAWKSDLIMAGRSRQFYQVPDILWKALTRPHRWNNIEDILGLEKTAGIQSIFFWLTEQRKVSVSDTIYIDHADYSFHMEAVSRLWQKVVKTGSQNGLHKSAFDLTFDEELEKLPETVSINRNHFLKMNVADHYKNIEKSGLKYDATLGFPEHFGFRNSYGRPFHPYNLQENRPYRFTEVPLHLMDTTFRTYLDMDFPEMMHKMKEFIDQHRYSCVISLLLHNSHFNFQNKEEVKLWKRFYSTMQGVKNYLPE